MGVFDALARVVVEIARGGARVVAGLVDVERRLEDGDQDSGVDKEEVGDHGVCRSPQARPSGRA